MRALSIKCYQGKRTETSPSKLLGKRIQDQNLTFRAKHVDRGYPDSLIMTTLPEIKFESRKTGLLQKCKEDKRIFFVTQWSETNTHAQKWHLIQQQPSVRFLQKGQKIYSFEPNSKINGYYTTWIWVLWACHRHYYHPCLRKMLEFLFLGGTFAAKVIFVLENTSFNLLLQMYPYQQLLVKGSVHSMRLRS